MSTATITGLLAGTIAWILTAAVLTATNRTGWALAVAGLGLWATALGWWLARVHTTGRDRTGGDR